MDPFAYLGKIVLSLIAELGPYGILIGMILESSVIPIPSEAILVTAGLAAIDPLSVALFCGVGSTIGSILLKSFNPSTIELKHIIGAR